VTRHAKASSARSSERQATGPGGTIRVTLATRVSSLRAEGDGGPSPRGRIVALALVTAALTLLALAPLSQAKVVVNGFGPKGTLGGNVYQPQMGIAFDETGAGAPAGTFYVAESNRVQRFSPSGEFVRIWGNNVVETGGVGDKGTSNDFEICTVALQCRVGSGGFLNGGSSGIAVSPTNGDIYTLEAGTKRVMVFDPEGNIVRIWGWDVVLSGKPNDVSTNAYEVCDMEAGNVFSDCQEGDSGANGGQFAPRNAEVVIDSSEHVWVADAANRRIEEFTLTGGFIAAYGYDVDSLGGGGGLEKCTSTAPGACQAGTQGAGPGQFSANNPQDVAFDSAGNLYAVDAGNDRVQKFDPTLLASATVFAPATFAARTSSWSEFGTSLVSVAPAPGGRLAFSLRNNVTANPAESQIIEVDPADGSVKDESLVGSGLSTPIRGLTFNAVTGTLYATFEGDLSITTPFRVLVFGAPLPAPAVSFDPIANKTDTTATFPAGVDPKGGLVSCKFEYSSDLEHWTDADASGARGSGTLTGTTTVTALTLGLNSFHVGQKIISSDGGIPMGTTIAAVGFDTLTLSQAATMSGPVTLTTPGCDTLTPGGGTQGVSANVTGLDPNTHYYVRMRTSRPLVAGSTATSSNASFETDSVPPAVTDAGAVDVTDVSARLVGTIDPRNSAAGYVFQYGLTPALGSSTPPLAIGAGTTPITVSQVIGSLSPDTTYYFKLFATNDFGTTASVTKKLHTRTDALPLPDDRRYEQVTPADKNYTDISGMALSDGTAGISADGNSAGFCTTALFGDPSGQMTVYCAQYVSRRTSGGWQTTNPFPKYCHWDPDSFNPGENRPAENQMKVYPSADFSRFVIQRPDTAGCPIPSLDPNAPLIPGETSLNLYRQDFTVNPFGYDLLNPELGNETNWGQNFLGGSQDFSHVVYQSYSNQTAPPDSPEPDEKFRKLYDWHNGSLNLITKDTSNEPFTTPSDVPTITHLGSPGNGVTIGSWISSDGERIFFHNPTLANAALTNSPCSNPGCEVYMREDGTSTNDISASECTTACGSPQTKADNFLSATPSGEVAFFVSCAKLSDDSSPEGACVGPWSDTGEDGSKLYRWDENLPPGNRLVDITADHEPGDGVQPNFRGLIGQSANGETAYFVTRGQVVSGEATAPGDKLYRWRWNGGSPTVDYLGPYLDIEGEFPAKGELNWLQKLRMVTPSGKYLLIYTELRYDPAADSDTDPDAYRWDEADGWICISCQRPGVPSAGGVSLNFEVWLHNLPGASIDQFASDAPRTFMSDDGQRIFFATADALVPGDVNGEASCLPGPQGLAKTRIPSCQDVYEWHDGTVSLISPGTGPGPARLIAATPSGRDVFFYTAERLVGWDFDTNIDVYDARIGGGFPEPAPQPSSCEGESCRGGGTSAPAPTGAGTAVFQGQGNPAPKHKATARKHHKKRHHKRQQRAKHNRRAGR
jgi:hypothetical protein